MNTTKLTQLSETIKLLDDYMDITERVSMLPSGRHRDFLYAVCDEVKEQINEVVINKKKESHNDQLSASEAVYAFAGYLTTREKSISIGCYQDCAKVAELVEEFNKSQQFKEPRDEFASAIKSFPKD